VWIVLCGACLLMRLCLMGSVVPVYNFVLQEINICYIVQCSLFCYYCHIQFYILTNERNIKCNCELLLFGNTAKKNCAVICIFKNFS
jgi:hypothetical protein